jgi:hypothetical protein
MFKFLKTATGWGGKPAAPPRATTANKPVPRRARPTGAGMFDPLPVPEVNESHDDSAWDEWENSKMELDSRMGPLSAFDSVKVKDASPSRHGELDPFASVRTRRK